MPSYMHIVNVCTYIHTSVVWKVCRAILIQLDHGILYDEIGVVCIYECYSVVLVIYNCICTMLLFHCSLCRIKTSIKALNFNLASLLWVFAI